MNINWHLIRSHNNSQNNGFEELVCQLAREEEIPNRKSFIRLGTPDGGVEAYWVLENGEEHGWQAKYFTTKLENSQWNQLNDSFKTALEKHPKLSKYYIAIPLDRSDPRIDRQKWFMDKWISKIAEWKKFANECGRIIDFEYWGTFELSHRLSLEKHAGRRYYWFGDAEFSNNWFEEQINRNIKNLGTRYIPEYHFNLPITKDLLGISCDPNFTKEFHKCLDGIKREYCEAFKYYKRDISKFQTEYENLISICDRFSLIDDKFPSQQISILFGILTTRLSEIEHDIRELKDDSKGWEISYLQQLRSRLYDLKDFTESTNVVSYNKPVLVIEGKAGVGKSHLLGDYIKKRFSNGMPSIFLLGQHFFNEEPWSQVLKLLDVKCTKAELLGALVAKAQSLNTRILFIIDAINEGEARIMWKNHVTNFIESFKPYQSWIGLILSVRTTYKRYIFPDLNENMAISLTHYGFSGKEFEALTHFFNIFKLDQPNAPIFNSEFSNPLFLLTFCQGLNKLGVKRLPDGYEGISSVFSNFLNGINKSLAEPEKLNYNDNFDLISDFTNAFVLKIIEKQSHYLTHFEAHAIAKNIFGEFTKSTRILDHIIWEGLLTEDLWWVNKKPIQIIRFSYERILDYYSAKTLIDKYFDKENPSKNFEPGNSLYSYIEDERACNYNSGLLESLSVLIPEVSGLELYELVPTNCKGIDSIILAFIESLKWRKTDTINGKAINYINEFIIPFEYYESIFQDTIISLTANPGHFFNADFLHNHLMKFSLPERDSWWSIEIHNRYLGIESSIKRIIDWSWSGIDKSHISGESIRLISNTISWFLTSSNRFLRDAATKALVSLLENRIDVLIVILKTFENVNDPYITERLYAAAYGCAMRSLNNEAIKKLALYVYDWAFIQGNLPVHLLTRDYIRGILELGIIVDQSIDINPDIIRPPYTSIFPQEIPSVDEIAKYKLEYPKEGRDYMIIGQNRLYDSVVGFDDFARYIIGTNHGLFNFSNQCFLQNRKLYERFYKSLKGKKRSLLKSTVDFHRILNDYYSFKPNEFISEEKLQELRKQVGEMLQGIESELISILDDEEIIIFRKIEVYLGTLHSEKRKTSRFENNFDLSVLQRLILKKSFELGWSKELFGEFDGRQNYYNHDGRSAHKAERIGKKYQWIAYYEYMARIADNYEYSKNIWEDEKEYLGTWQDFKRDIDPSLLIKSKPDDENTENDTAWWISDYSINTNIQEEIWRESIDDIPDFKNFIEVIDQNRVSWLVLRTLPEWKSQKDFETNRSFWISLNGYVIHKKDRKKLIPFLSKQNFMGNWMPNPLDHSKAFNGEYYKLPAYFDTYKNVIGKNTWRNVKNRGKVVVLSDQYYWGGNNYDCSIGETLHISKPSLFLYELLELQPSKDNIHFYNKIGELVCFDPSIKERNYQNALLVRKDVLLEKLELHDYDIFWTVLGEKIVYDDKYNGIVINGVYYFEEGSLTGNIQTKDR